MAIPQFPVNAQRFDPYKNFKFRVKFGESPNYVAGVSKVSGLKRTTGSMLTSRHPDQLLKEAAFRVLAYTLRR